ncbi:MAG: YidC/Oxa1 family membrane protein insertase [Solirubrobacterales bacterium]
MWTALVGQFQHLIQFSYDLTNAAGYANYGLAIILVTIIFKVILLPLTHSSMKSMRKMQALQPQMKVIQERYKDNTEKQQTEIMKLYKEAGTNPLGGCLPILIQMPIMIAFYQALQRFTYTSDPSFLWIDNLSKADPLYILPVLVAASMFIQQRLSTVDTNDPTQRTMLYVMPILFGYITLKLPAGLSVYWVFFSILSIIHQQYINRFHPIPEAAAAAAAPSVPATQPANKPVVESTEQPRVKVKRVKGGKNGASGREARKKR